MEDCGGGGWGDRDRGKLGAGGGVGLTEDVCRMDKSKMAAMSSQLTHTPL